jgi:hypothetical protein
LSIGSTISTSRRSLRSTRSRSSSFSKNAGDELGVGARSDLNLHRHGRPAQHSQPDLARHAGDPVNRATQCSRRL